MNFDKDLDARGLNCPLPILREKKIYPLILLVLNKKWENNANDRKK